MSTRQSSTKRDDAKAVAMAAVAEQVRKALGLETLETRNSDALDFLDPSVWSIREVIQMAFDAGYAAAGRSPAPGASTSPTDPSEMLDTLKVTKQTGRLTGGTWVTGTIAGHAFEALLFTEHATDPAFELDGSRISKLWLQELPTRTEVACFDRGWDRGPTTDAARTIVDLLAAGLAEHVFGK